MILLLPAYTLFLLARRAGRLALDVRPSVIVLLAITCAAAGALQYAWNLRTLWYRPQPPHGLSSRRSPPSGSTSRSPTGATRW